MDIVINCMLVSEVVGGQQVKEGVVGQARAAGDPFVPDVVGSQTLLADVEQENPDEQTIEKFGDFPQRKSTRSHEVLVFYTLFDC